MADEVVVDTKIEQPTLRDDIAAAYDAAEAGATPAVVKTEADPAIAEETEEQKAGRLAGRARDEKGRVLPGKAVKTDAAPLVQKATVPSSGEPQPAPAVAAHESRPKYWKKDHWEAFDKIATENPTLAKYINQREAEYASGVSAYKQEWESAKPLIDAVAPFMPTLQQNGIDPAKWITNLGNAHQRLVTSSPQDKLALFQQLASEYRIPAQLAVQDAQGQWQLLGQMQPPAQPQQQAAPHPQNIESIVEAALTKKEINNEYQRFLADIPEKYPHFEEVKATMQGLLQAELAKDYPSAYEAALRHPRHAGIYDAMQEQQRAAADADAKAKAVAAAASARARATGIKSATPSGAALQNSGKNSLHDSIADAYDAHAGGRV